MNKINFNGYSKEELTGVLLFATAIADKNIADGLVKAPSGASNVSTHSADFSEVTFSEVPFAEGDLSTYIETDAALLLDAERSAKKYAVKRRRELAFADAEFAGATAIQGDLLGVNVVGENDTEDEDGNVLERIREWKRRSNRQW